MSSTTRMLVLGVVRIFQPVHGYDVRRELVKWHVEDWAQIAPGSIYNALKSLTRDGELEVVGTKQVGSRPERTTYRLTTAGEQELSELISDTWWTVRTPIDPLVAGLSLLGFMRRDEAIAALEARISTVEAALAREKYLMASIDDVEVPDHVREMMRLIGARNAAEIPWARAFIARLRAGEYRLADDPPKPWSHVKRPAPAKPAAPTRTRRRKPAP